MPTKLEESVRASSSSESIEEGRIRFSDTEITELKAGKVTAEELVIPLPKGTQVVDAIRGTGYVIGENGQHLNEKQFMGKGAGAATIKTTNPPGKEPGEPRSEHVTPRP
jgi:hypothetical protein